MAEHRVTQCPSCGADVIWAISARNGTRQPIDAEPSAAGSIRLTARPDQPPLAEVITNAARRFGLKLRVAHHATCPKPIRHGRPTTPRRTPA